MTKTKLQQDASVTSEIDTGPKVTKHHKAKQAVKETKEGERKISKSTKQSAGSHTKAKPSQKGETEQASQNVMFVVCFAMWVVGVYLYHLMTWVVNRFTYTLSSAFQIGP